MPDKNVHNQKVTPQLLNKMREMRAEGMYYRQIAREVGLGETTVHTWLKYGSSKNRNRINYSEFVIPTPVPTEIKRKAYEMWLQVPKDTRDMTARLCGDPLPGRSALDQRQNA